MENDTDFRKAHGNHVGMAQRVFFRIGHAEAGIDITIATGSNKDRLSIA